MAKVILVCGKICSGKTTYAKRLQAARPAVLLSVDEVMLAVFGPDAGRHHDAYAAGVRRCLLHKAPEIVRAGVDVILDWGFWTRASRCEARAFFQKEGIACEVHYLDVDQEQLAARTRQRNALVRAGGVTAYPVDRTLAAKCEAAFEPPQREEVDVWPGGPPAAGGKNA